MIRLPPIVTALVIATATLLPGAASAQNRLPPRLPKKGSDVPQRPPRLPTKPVFKQPDRNRQPSISGITPLRGGPGAVVTIKGSELTGCQVQYNGQPVKIMRATRSALLVRVPATAKRSGAFVVNKSNYRPVRSPSFRLTTAAPSRPSRRPTAQPAPSRQPSVSGVTPTLGPELTLVKITGTNFDTRTQVVFNGRVLSVLRRSSTQLLVRIPRGSRSGTIVVRKPGYPELRNLPQFRVTRTGGGTSPVVRPNQTQPNRPQSRRPARRPGRPTLPANPLNRRPTVTGISPTSGPELTLVTITGTHFDTRTQVVFNGRSLPILRRSVTQLLVRIPRSARSGTIVVRKPGHPELRNLPQFRVTRPGINTRPPHPTRRPTPTIPGVVRRPNTTIRNPAPGHFRKPAQAQPSYQPPIAAVRPRPPITAPGRLPPATVRPAPGSSWHGRDRRVEGFSPGRGGPGTIVTIRGANFKRYDRVYLAGRRVRLRHWTPNAIRVRIGRRHRSGQFEIRGRGQHTAMSSGRFEVVRPPTVRSFRPRRAAVSGQIQIFGRNFLPGDQVEVGGRPLIVRSLSPQRIIANVPNGVASGRIGIRRDGQFYRSRGVLQILMQPFIASISPTSGTPGTWITIRGGHFGRRPRVLLGSTALRLRRQGGDVLRVQVPTRCHTGPLIVSTESGTVTSAAPFVVNQLATATGFQPRSGPPGTTVCINGRAFDRVTRVQLNNLVLPIARVSPNRICFRIPPGARSGRFLVESYGKRSSTRQAFQVVARGPDMRFTVTPTSVRPGAEVTLNLTPGRTGVGVFFNGRPLPTKTYDGGRRIVVTIPGDARHSAHIEIESGGKRYRSPHPIQLLR